MPLISFCLFQKSTTDPYQTMNTFMQSQSPSVYTATNEEGRDRVKKEDYAFLMESTSIEYIVQRHCELKQIGGLLDNKGYGIALRPGNTVQQI